MTPRARNGLLALAVVGFLGALYLQLPAALVLRFLPASLPAPWSAHAAGLTASGTLWQGDLRGLQFAGLPLQVLRWQLSPWAVLTGRLRGEVHLAATGVVLNGTFNTDFNGFGELSAVRGELPLALLQTSAKDPWRGQLRLRLDSASLAPVGLADVVGTVDVLALSSPAVSVPLGDYRLEWSRGSNQGRISTLRGPVALNAALLPVAGGGWRLDGEATPSPDAPATVRQALMVFGLPDANGRYRVQAEYGVSALP